MLITLATQLLIALMKKQRLSYESAEDGLQALDKFKENPDKYFLILMDVSVSKNEKKSTPWDFETDFFADEHASHGRLRIHG
jgi:CheY-like chemotaxis protein